MELGDMVIGMQQHKGSGVIADAVFNAIKDIRRTRMILGLGAVKCTALPTHPPWHLQATSLA
eukprot:62450-Pelagomonas_calceolata.AAC.8